MYESTAKDNCTCNTGSIDGICPAHGTKQRAKSGVTHSPNRVVAPVLAAIQKRIAAGHNDTCDKVKFRIPMFPCTCGHDELVAAIALMTAEQEMKK